MGRKDEIKECFVAFIDVLGFKEMIDRDNGTGEYLKIVKNAINDATKTLKERQSEEGGEFEFWFNEFNVKSFSDCFCFSIPLEFKNGEKDYVQNLVAFYVWLKVFYNELLNKGFLCRGGITQGWHYVDDDIIFSKALVDAYLLESKRAKHPIFVISNELLSQIEERSFHSKPFYKFMFNHDNSGRNFFNPFNYSIVDEMYFAHRPENNLGIVKEYRDLLLEKYKDIVSENIKKYTGSAVEKNQWLKELISFELSGKYQDKFFKGLKYKSS